MAQTATKLTTPKVGSLLTTPKVGSLRPTGRFVAEFFGMCAVMCVGGQILSFAFFEGARSLGYGNLAQQVPALSVLAIAIALSVPMTAYMTLRGHGGRHNLEMSAGTFAVAILLIGASSLSILSLSSIGKWQGLFGLVCLPACVVMFLVMLRSLNMYTGRAGHHAHA